MKGIVKRKVSREKKMLNGKKKCNVKKVYQMNQQRIKKSAKNKSENELRKTDKKWSF